MKVLSSLVAVGYNWIKLEAAKNKSKVVNQAVAYFFAAQKFLKKKEIEFIEKELQHYKDTGESYGFDETFS